MERKQYHIFCLVGSILSASAISIILNLRTSNILTGIFALVLYHFYTMQGEKRILKWKQNLPVLAVSIFCATCMTLKGFDCFDHYSSIGSLGKAAILCCILSGFLLLFYNLVDWMYLEMDRMSIGKTATGNDSVQLRRKSCQAFGFTFSTLLVCWLLYYLKNYPAVIISDSMDQLGQAVTGIYSNHHPVIQTWLLQLFLAIGNLMGGTLSTGVALYCIAQMVILAAIYAYVVKTLFEYGVRKWIYILVAAFYALMPYNVMFSINIWKDTLFSAGFLLFITVLWKYIFRKSEHQRITDLLIFFLSGCCITLFRNNGFYAFLLIFPFICVVFWKKQKRIVGVAVGILLTTILIKGPIFSYNHVAQPDAIESLSIPAQQIARVVSDGGTLTEEQTQLLSQIIDVDSIAATYDKHVSDPIKNLVRASDNQDYLVSHKIEYLKFWLDLGVHHPFQYLSAYMDQTEGFWYPDVQHWVYTEGVCENAAGIMTESKLPSGMERYIKWIAWDTYTAIPIYGLCWSIGTTVWMTVFFAGYCLRRGRKRELLLFLPMLALWGTLMVATPVYAEFRYLYAIFVCLPMYLIIAMIPDGFYT